jgi:hypothetical protein
LAKLSSLNALQTERKLQLLSPRILRLNASGSAPTAFRHLKPRVLQR